MNEIDIMKRAKQYIESLANGIDPLTGNELPDSDIVNNVRISRCLFYTAGVLQQVIDNGGKVNRERINPANLAPFALKAEQIASLRPADKLLSLSRTLGIVNKLIDIHSMKMLKAVTVGNWLLRKGLFHVVTINGMNYNYPTPLGEQIGITLSEYTTPSGCNIKVPLYSREAQQFIFDNIEEIIAFAASDGGTDPNE